MPQTAGQGFASGFAKGRALRLERDRLEYEKELAEAQTLVGTLTTIRTRSIEQFKAALDQATANAATLSQTTDPETREQLEESIAAMRQVAQASVATFDNAYQKFLLASETSGADVTGLPEVGRFSNDSMKLFDAGVTGAGVATVQTLSPNEVVAAGFPKDAVVQRKGDGTLDLIFDPTDDESTLKERVDLLVASGVEPNHAGGIAAGRFFVSRHPITNEVAVVDLATGKTVGKVETPAPTDDVPPVVPPGTEVSGAVGAEGFFKNAVNTVTDMIGAGAAYPDELQGTTALQAIQTTTQLLLQVAIPGRPAKDIREELKKMLVEPNSLLTGEARAQSKMIQMRRFIDNNIKEKESALNGPIAPETRTALTNNIRELKVMRESYDDLLEGFDKAVADVPEGVGAADAAQWHLYSDEVKALILKEVQADGGTD